MRRLALKAAAMRGGEGWRGVCKQLLARLSRQFLPEIHNCRNAVLRHGAAHQIMGYENIACRPGPARKFIQRNWMRSVALNDTNPTLMWSTPENDDVRVEKRQ